MSVAAEFEVANQKYEASYTKADLPMPPGRYMPPDSLLCGTS
jgi:carbonic anhydrase